jgi:hypothetical protein
VYNAIGMRHKDKDMLYAGFILDDYKNKMRFTNLIVNIKEADEKTLLLCEAVYKRFKELVK